MARFVPALVARMAARAAPGASLRSPAAAAGWDFEARPCAARSPPTVRRRTGSVACHGSRRRVRRDSAGRTDRQTDRQTDGWTEGGREGLAALEKGGRGGGGYGEGEGEGGDGSEGIRAGWTCQRGESRGGWICEGISDPVAFDARNRRDALL